MRKILFLNSLLILIIVILISVTINSCRKKDKIPEEIETQETTPTDIESKFFTKNIPTEPAIQEILNFVKKKNDISHFVKKIVSEIGYPFWNKSLTINGANSFGRGASDSSQITYIPFARENENFINATLLVRTSDVDTLVQFLCNWQYKDYGFDTSSSNLNARNIFHIFSTFDNLVFNHKNFIITDGRILGYDSIDHIRVEIEENDYPTTLGRASILTPVYLCTPYKICHECLGRNSSTSIVLPCCDPIYFSECTSFWVDDGWTPVNGGGGSGGGGGGGGGGNEGGMDPPDCEGVNPNIAERNSLFENPCEPGWLPFDDDLPLPELTIDDLKNYKNVSAVIEDMEIQAGITSSNFETMIHLGTTSQTIPSPSSFKIYINKSLSLEKGLFSYAHELNNAININQIRTLIYNAYSSPKTSTNRTLYADGMAYIEAKGVYSQIIVAIETSTTNELPLFPVNVINAVNDALNGTITAQEALYIIFDFIKFGDAIDDSGNPIYQGYLEYYDDL